MKRLQGLVAAVFLVNIAGAGAQSENPAIRLALDLADGCRVIGTPSIAAVKTQTFSGDLHIPVKLIRSFHMQRDRTNALFVFRNGDRLTGVPDLKSVELTTIFGVIKVDLQHVAKATVLISGRGPGEGLVLWNKLGSLQEIENSEVGPGAAIFGGAVSFVPGKFGNGFTSGAGKSGPNFGLWEKINPHYDQAGTVDFWWKPARAFNEGNSPPDEVFVSGKWEKPWKTPFQLLYRWRESDKGIGGFDFQLELGDDGGQRCLYTGKKAPFQAGDWVHVAFVWDMNGLPGNPTVRYTVFVDGKEYPLVDSGNPEAEINCTMAKPPGAYFAMGYYDADSNNQMRGVIDNVRIWDYAKTDLADRDEEGAAVAEENRRKPKGAAGGGE